MIRVHDEGDGIYVYGRCILAGLVELALGARLLIRARRRVGLVALAAVVG